MRGVDERRYVRVALAATAALLAVLAVGSAARDLVADEPSRLERMADCLEDERGFPITSAPADSPAVDADGGAFGSVVETNAVTIAIAGSQEQAEELERTLAATTAGTRRRLERRGDLLFVWERPPSPTQRQAVYDCSY